MRLVLYALALAFLVWLIVAARSHDADPATLTPTTEPPDPPPEPPAAAPEAERLTVELGETRRRLAASERARSRERRGYRRRLNYVIHAPIYRGHWLERAFLCIHSGEGSWGSNTGNGYHGGLQMDRSFMQAYGREFYEAWGTADNWPPFIQVSVAMRAYLAGRGFGPWPNTARACGLL